MIRLVATVFNETTSKYWITCSLSSLIKVAEGLAYLHGCLLLFFPLEIDLFRSAAALVDDNFDRLDDAELFLL